MACILASFFTHQLLGLLPGVLFAAAAICLGKLGLDSKGRAVALASLIAGILLVGIYLTVFIVGKENIDIAPRAGLSGQA